MEFKIDGIENNPIEINYDQSINVLFSFKNAILPKTYYLEGVFQQTSGSRYFGYTWSNNNWYQYGEDYANFYKLEINESSISGKLLIKPDSGADGFKGTGEYQLKIFRFCSSQSPCGETNSIAIKIIAPLIPTPTPTPTQTATTTPTLTKTPTPAPTKSPTSTSKPTQTPQPTVLAEETPEAFVLGVESEKTKKSFPFLAFLFIAVGLMCIGTGFFLVIKKSKEYNEKSEKNN